MSGPRRPLLAATVVSLAVAAVVLLLVAVGTLVPDVRDATARLPILPIVLATTTAAMLVRLIRPR